MTETPVPPPPKLRIYHEECPYCTFNTWKFDTRAEAESDLLIHIENKHGSPAGNENHIFLPWHPWWAFWGRCRAVADPDTNGRVHWGRCELVAGHKCDHALERGMETPRWSTKWTG